MDLIASYQNSDSEEDSDPWVRSRVSTKRTADNDERPRKKIDRLPQPNIKLTTTVRYDETPVIDDPSLHSGKTRSFPHERGNWASFVYIPVNVATETRFFLDKLIEFCLPVVQLTLSEDFHVSLTRTVVLRHHWIEEFTSSFRKSFSLLSSFTVYFQDIEIYVNDDRTRTFVGLKIWDPSLSLINLVSIADSLLADLSLPPFYKNPSFHVSVAWCVGDRKRELEELLRNFTELPSGEAYFVKEIFCKIGHLRYNCSLKN